MPDVLVVGAGPAGSACAEELRSLGFEGSILLAGREPDPPYDRPPASKGYLAGAVARADCLLHPPEFWQAAGIDLRVRTSVMRLDTQEKTAKLASGEVVDWQHAVLATGANVRRLRVEGGALGGVHYLRALANADAIRADAGEARSVVLVGGSYIACEVAATLTASLGRRCTLVMPEERPLQPAFGEAAGRYFEELLRSNGVELVTGEAVAGFEGEADRVQRVRTEAGRTIDADMVVIGTGVVPDVMLARSAGLELGDTGGIRCDAGLRASAPGVWAAGDVCEFDSVLHGRSVRIEHWEVARAQGRHVARAICGSEEPFADVPYYWSDLADWASLEYVGGGLPWESAEPEGAGDSFAVRHLAGGRLVGYLSVNGGGDLEAARRELAAASGVDA